MNALPVCRHTEIISVQHHNKNQMPCLCAGIAWLLDKFKAYVILRDRLLSDTSILRDKLEVAAPEVANGQSNANASTSKQCCAANTYPMPAACVAACLFC